MSWRSETPRRVFDQFDSASRRQIPVRFQFHDLLLLKSSYLILRPLLPDHQRYVPTDFKSFYTGPAFNSYQAAQLPPSVARPRLS